MAGKDETVYELSVLVGGQEVVIHGARAALLGAITNWSLVSTSDDAKITVNGYSNTADAGECVLTFRAGDVSAMRMVRFA